MEKLVSLIDTPKKAVLFLRERLSCGPMLRWDMVGEISELHFLGFIPHLHRHLTCRNDTGLKALFTEHAERLTRALPGAMTLSRNAVSSEEAEAVAYRITLLYMLADIVRALHNRQELVIYPAKPAVIEKAA